MNCDQKIALLSLSMIYNTFLSSLINNFDIFCLFLKMQINYQKKYLSNRSEQHKYLIF